MSLATYLTRVFQPHYWQLQRHGGSHGLINHNVVGVMPQVGLGNPFPAMYFDPFKYNGWWSGNGVNDGLYSDFKGNYPDFPRD